MNILVFQHLATEHPGSFRDVIAAGGHKMFAVELDEGEPIPSLEGFDALLVMGGPQDVWQEAEYPWLRAEKAAINEWVTACRPYLGICLGGQLLAEAMGGEVGPMEGPPEVGMNLTLRNEEGETDPLFAALPNPSHCFHWHGAEVKTLPPTARLLGIGDVCTVQAFRIGTYAYGLQYHMELTPTTAAEWATYPAYIAALERALGPGALPKVQAEVRQHFTDLHRTAQTMFANFLRIAERINNPVPVVEDF